jgi:hypothetical protein
MMISPEESFLESHDTLQSRLKSALYSRTWFAMLVVLTLVSVASFVLFVANVARKETWFVVMEALLNLALLAEVGARLVVFGRLFWKDWSNVVDVIVCFCVVGAFVIYLVRTEDGVVFAVLLALRYSLQCVRLWLVYRKRVEFQQRTDQIVDFGSAPLTKPVFED